MATRKKVVAKKSTAGKLLSVNMGRFDSAKIVQCKEGTTVKELFESNNYIKAEYEQYYDSNGNNLSGNETVTGNIGYFLVEKTKNGGI